MPSLMEAVQDTQWDVRKWCNHVKPQKHVSGYIEDHLKRTVLRPTFLSGLSIPSDLLLLLIASSAAYWQLFCILQYRYTLMFNRSCDVTKDLESDWQLPILEIWILNSFHKTWHCIEWSQTLGLARKTSTDHTCCTFSLQPVSNYYSWLNFPNINISHFIILYQDMFLLNLSTAWLSIISEENGFYLFHLLY